LRERPCVAEQARIGIDAVGDLALQEAATPEAGVLLVPSAVGITEHDRRPMGAVSTLAWEQLLVARFELLAQPERGSPRLRGSWVWMSLQGALQVPVKIVDPSRTKFWSMACDHQHLVLSTPERYCIGEPGAKSITTASKKAPDIGGLLAFALQSGGLASGVASARSGVPGRFGVGETELSPFISRMLDVVGEPVEQRRRSVARAPNTDVHSSKGQGCL